MWNSLLSITIIIVVREYLHNSLRVQVMTYSWQFLPDSPRLDIAFWSPSAFLKNTSNRWALLLITVIPDLNRITHFPGSTTQNRFSLGLKASRLILPARFRSRHLFFSSCPPLPFTQPTLVIRKINKMRFHFSYFYFWRDISRSKKPHLNSPPAARRCSLLGPSRPSSLN